MKKITFPKLLLFITFFLQTAGISAQKSVYVIADINSTPTPIQAWGIQGTSLFFQAEYLVPDWGYGAVGLAVDVDSAFLFVTYENSNIIQLLDATTMTDQGTVTAPGADNLSGIVYDKTNSHIYTVDRMTPNLYSYLWNASNKVLTLEGVFTLDSAAAWGISLDFTDSLLYIANYNMADTSSYITVYNTQNWQLTSVIDSLVYGNVINVEIDVNNKLLYYGGFVANNNNIAVYDINTGDQWAVQLEPGAGIMGTTVDQETGLVYITTGFSGDNIKTFDPNLNLLFQSGAIGNPTDIVTGNVGYNPCSFEVSTDECAFQGEQHTFELCYENPFSNPAIGIVIEAGLPPYCSFVSATGGGIYHQETNSVVWDIGTVPPSTPQTCHTFTVDVSPDAPFPATLSLNAVLSGDSIGTVPVGPAYYSVDFYICRIPTCTISGDQTICKGEYAAISLSLTGSAPWKVTCSDGTTQTVLEDITQPDYTFYVSPETTTVYTVIEVTGAHGLSNNGTGSATVNVSESVIPQLSGEFELCLYDSPVQYSTPLEIGTTYLWEVSGGNILSGQNSNTVLVEWPEPGTGYIKVTQTLLSTNCALSDEKNVFVYSVPVIGFEFNDTTLCPDGDTISLFPLYYPDSSSLLWTCSDQGNQWNNYQGDTITLYTTGVGFYAATYYLNITSNKGCIDSDTVEVIFDFDACDNAIEDKNGEKEVSIFPNPAKRFVNITVAPNIKLPLRIVLFDNKGREFFNRSYTSRDIIIDLSHRKSGVVYAKLYSENFISTSKFVLKK